MKSQRKLATLLSYTNTAINMIISLFLTPLLISSLGMSEYGVYKIIQSFAGQLIVMSFGISVIVVRNINFYNVKKEIREKENFLFTAHIISAFLGILVLCVGTIMYAFLDKMYGGSLNIDELNLAKLLFVFLIVTTSIRVASDSSNGILLAHEKYIAIQAVNLTQYIIRIVSIIVLLKLGFGSIAIVATDLVLAVCILLFRVLYNKIVIKEHAKYHYLDKQQIKLCFTFSLAMLLQSIANQVNQNLDSVILGIMTDTSKVTVYSIGLVIFTSFCSVVLVISGMYDAAGARLVANNATPEEMTDFVIRPGRYQMMIAGILISGFILFGKEFILLWVGKGYEDVYKITLLLIIPEVIPCIEATTLPLLNAKLKRMGRSIIIIIMCFINIIASVIFIKCFGYVGAAYGTCLSIVVGEGILINIYLKRTLHLNILRMFKGIFKGILPCIICLTICGLFVVKQMPTGVIWLIIQIVVYSVVYICTIYFLGTNKSEKNMMRALFSKILTKRSEK